MKGFKTIKTNLNKLAFMMALAGASLNGKAECVQIQLPEGYIFLGIDYVCAKRKIVAGRCSSKYKKDFSTKCFYCIEGKTEIVQIPPTLGSVFRIKDCSEDGSVIYLTSYGLEKEPITVPIYVKERLFVPKESGDDYQLLRSSLSGIHQQTLNDSYSSTCSFFEVEGSEFAKSDFSGETVQDILRDDRDVPFAFLTRNQADEQKIHFKEGSDSSFSMPIGKKRCSFIKSPRVGTEVFIETADVLPDCELIELDGPQRRQNREILSCSTNGMKSVLNRKQILGYVGDDLFQDVWYTQFALKGEFLFLWYRSIESGCIKYIVKNIQNEEFLSLKEFATRYAGLNENIKKVHDICAFNDVHSCAFLATNMNDETKLYILRLDD